MQCDLHAQTTLDDKVLSKYAQHPAEVIAIHSHMHCLGLPCLLVMGERAHARGWREAEGRGGQAVDWNQLSSFLWMIACLVI